MKTKKIYRPQINNEGRDATKEENDHFNLTITSSRVLLVVMTEEMFLYGYDFYDYIEENFRNYHHMWGKKALSKMIGREAKWKRKLRVDQDGHKTGSLDSFATGHYMKERMKTLRQQVEFTFSVALGRRGVQNPELVAKTLLWYKMADAINESAGYFAEVLADFAYNIARTPREKTRAFCMQRFAPAMIQHPEYMADAYFHFINKADMLEIFKEYDSNRAWEAYKNVFDSTWKLEDMLNAMDINGDTDLQDIIDNLNGDKELAMEVAERLRGKIRTNKEVEI